MAILKNEYQKSHINLQGTAVQKRSTDAVIELLLS